MNKLKAIDVKVGWSKNIITMNETITFLLSVLQNLLKQMHNKSQNDMKMKMIPIGARAVRAILKNMVDPPNYLKL